MKKPTKTQIEAVSRLLQACRRCGAEFKTGATTWITMPDATVFHIKEKRSAWRLSWLCTDRYASVDILIPKDSGPQEIQKSIISLHLKILEKFALPAASHG